MFAEPSKYLHIFRRQILCQYSTSGETLRTQQQLQQKIVYIKCLLQAHNGNSWHERIAKKKKNWKFSEAQNIAFIRKSNFFRINKVYSI